MPHAGARATPAPYPLVLHRGGLLGLFLCCLLAAPAVGGEARAGLIGVDAALDVMPMVDPEDLTQRELAVEIEKAKVVRELDAATREREAALKELRAMSEAFGHIQPDEDDQAQGDGEDGLAGEIETLKSELAAFKVAPARAGADPWAVRWEIEITEMRLKRLRERAGTMSGSVREWIGGQLASIERLLDRAGADTGRLLARVADSLEAGGQGGPLELVAQDEVTLALAPADGAFSEEVQHLAATKQLLAFLPLAVPIQNAHVTSRYGVRHDPITRHRAMHGGLDFGAPEGSGAMATAPGTVIEAGRHGAYGIMVEIDHGFGVVTRYAHLSAAKVVPGQKVVEGQTIGIIGSTGRSTGRHLHYEIMIDGRHLDPAGFLRAGEKLATILNGERA